MACTVSLRCIAFAVQRYYDFGVASLIRNRLSTNPEYCQARGRERDTTPTAAMDAQMPSGLMRGLGASSQTLGTSYDLALDWAQVFTFATWSQGLLMLRCISCSLPLQWVAKPAPAMQVTSDDDDSSGTTF